MKPKYLSVLIITVLTACCHLCFGQFKDVSYHTMATAGWVKEIRSGNDSLYISQKRAGNIENIYQYKILLKEKIGKYHLVYVKRELEHAAYSSLSKYPSKSYINVFVYRLSDDKNTLHLLNLIQPYTSVKDAQVADDTIQFDNKYFTTWYSDTKFADLTHLPDFINADVATTRTVMDKWVYALNRGHDRSKMLNTYNVDFSIDILSKTLVANKFSPLVNFDDLSKKLAQNKVRLPPVIPLRTNKIITRHDTIDPKYEIHIDAPVANH